MSSSNAAAYSFLSVPAKLPKEWQPKLHEWKTFHSSHPDVAREGWKKWSAEHPDWYAYRSTSCHPDWFNREVSRIRRADYKNLNWHWERPSKPTSRNHDDFVPFNGEIQMTDILKAIPHNKNYRGSWTFPRPFPQEVIPPKWGLSNPPSYQEPTRLNHFPPIRHSGYQPRDQ